MLLSNFVVVRYSISVLVQKGRCDGNGFLNI